MTLDQVWFRLCDAKILKREEGNKIVEKKSLSDTSILADEDGKIPGLDVNGNPIRGIIRGKSVVREMMEKEEERKRNEKRKERKRRRKRRR